MATLLFTYNAALGFGVLKARANGFLVTDDDGNQIYTFSVTSENASTDILHCYPHIVLYYPAACRFPLSPSAHKELQSRYTNND